jgi:hypothetical protein
VQHVLAVLLLDAKAEHPQAVHQRQREEERGARHVHLVDGLAPRRGVPAGGAAEEPADLRMHQPHARGGRPAWRAGGERARLVHEAHEAAGLGEPAGGGLAEPAGEGQGLVSCRAAVPGDERAKPEHDATEEAGPEQYLPAAAGAVEVGPERKRGERLPQRTELRRDRVEVTAKRQVDQTLALLRSPVGERFHRGVRERVARPEEHAHPVDAWAEAAPGLLDMDEASGKHGCGPGHS